MACRFCPERDVTPESLHNFGINSYIQEESCFNYGDNPPTGYYDSLDGMYADLNNLGKILNVEDRANTLTEELRTRPDAVAKNREQTTSQSFRL